jgi:hypothetical protein
MTEVYRGLFPDWGTAMSVAHSLTRRATDEYRSDRAIVRRAPLGYGYGWQVVGVRTS